MNINLDNIRAIPIEDFMVSIGCEIENRTTSNFFFKPPYRVEKTASLSVWKKKNRWKDFGTGEGGDIIELAQKIWNVNFKEAITRLDNQNYSPISINKGSIDKKRKIELKKINETVNNKALINYMKKRFISPKMAHKLVSEIYYHLVDTETGELLLHPNTNNPKEYFGLAFKNDVGGYEIRNKYFKGCYGTKHFTTIKKGFDSVSVFEGFIDFLSLASEKEIKSDIIVLNSCTMAEKAIPIIAKYQKAFLLLDNDKSGNATTELLTNSIGNKAIDLRYLYKEFEDVNDWVTTK